MTNEVIMDIALEYKLPSGEFAIFDPEDSDLIGQFSWCKNALGYVVAKTKTGSRSIPRKTVLMHGLVMMRPIDCIIDHINGNPLDNRKDNLRYCSYSENQMNVRKKGRNGLPTSQHKGVSWSVRGYWQVVVRVDGRLKFIGKFEHESDAAQAAEPYFQTDFHLNGATPKLTYNIR